MIEKEHWGYKEVGYKYTTESRVVTGTELDLFCDITGLRGDVFLSDDAAKARGAKGRFLPGFFLMAITMGLIKHTGITRGGIFLGTNNIKINSMVYPSDTVRAEGELLNRKLTSKGDRVMVTYSWFLRNQDDVVVAQGENICNFPNPKWTG